MGKRGSSSGFQSGSAQAQEPDVSFPRYPSSVIMRGTGAAGGAPAEDREKARKIRKEFMAQAQIGDVYQVGPSFGSSGSTEIEIVAHRRSPNGMGIKARGSNARPVAMTNAQVDRWIFSGVKLLQRGQQQSK